MPHADPHPDAFAAFCHDLKGPLTIIKGRAQLALRDVDRFAGLSEAERERLHRHLATIAGAVEEMADRIDGHAPAR
jgi:signal transduction histidine kinase